MVTRISSPEKFATAKNVPAVDSWLAIILREDFTRDGVGAKSRISD